MFVRKMGLSFYVDLHVRVDGDISVRDGHDIAHAVKRAIQETDRAHRRRARAHRAGEVSLPLPLLNA